MQVILNLVSFSNTFMRLQKSDTMEMTCRI